MISRYPVLSVSLLAVILITGLTGQHITNLNEACFQCLCHVATQCQLSIGCAGGHCGPYYVSKIYWSDAGQAVLHNDDPERNLAWADCARDYTCSKKIVGGYMKKYGKDCNGDGVTNCYDYMLIHVNGGFSCTTPLNQTENGRRSLQRYEKNCLNKV